MIFNQIQRKKEKKWCLIWELKSLKERGEAVKFK